MYKKNQQKYQMNIEIAFNVSEYVNLDGTVILEKEMTSN
jgi:hypothetical protein